MAQKNVNNIKNNDFLKKLLIQNTLLKPLLANKDSLKIQIIYTQINRDKHNVPSFKKFNFNVSDEMYFYPASTIKLPVAILALQKLNELNIEGVDKNTAIIEDSAYNNQSPIFNDPTTEKGVPTIAHYIKKIFLVSDNEANNRLYEFVGQEYLNNELSKRGFKDAQILHRLGISLTETENRKTAALLFANEMGKPLYKQATQLSRLKYLQRNDFVGKGYYQNNVLKTTPFNFSTKNRLYLDDLNEMLLRIIFPEKYSADKKFNLKPQDYSFLYKCMSQKPTESIFPAYDSSLFYDAYCKFLLYGSQKGTIPPNIRIFNKVGDAYGFLTDIAYIVDFENKIEFAISATIYANKDEVLNDDKYDYDSIGFPFMKNLGKTIYEYELKRERKHEPDLNKFKISYDK